MEKDKPVIDGQKRLISTVGFPYFDLTNAEELAKTILDNGGSLTRDQLAGVMGSSSTSGAFWMKLSAAKMFGLVEQTPQGKLELTQTGFDVLDKDEWRKKAGRKEAFLKVPLYRRMYDEFRGKPLPARPHGIEQAFTRFGVSEKQKGVARLAFDKSATTAGFFSAGIERLIEPIIVTVPSANLALDTSAPMVAEAVGRARASSDLHPFIKGLIEALPKPGDPWPTDKRAKWLRAAANNFDLMYIGDGQITIVEVKTSENPQGTKTQKDDDEIPF